MLRQSLKLSHVVSLYAKMHINGLKHCLSHNPSDTYSKKTSSSSTISSDVHDTLTYSLLHSLLSSTPLTNLNGEDHTLLFISAASLTSPTTLLNLYDEMKIQNIPLSPYSLIMVSETAKASSILMECVQASRDETNMHHSSLALFLKNALQSALQEENCTLMLRIISDMEPNEVGRQAKAICKVYVAKKEWYAIEKFIVRYEKIVCHKSIFDVMTKEVPSELVLKTYSKLDNTTTKEQNKMITLLALDSCWHECWNVCNEKNGKPFVKRLGDTRNFMKNAKTVYIALQKRELLTLQVYNSFLLACGRTGDPQWAAQIVHEMNSSGILPDATSYGACIASVPRGNLDLIMHYFKASSSRNTFLYTQMLAACSKNRAWDVVLDLYAQLQDETNMHVSPSSTSLAIIAACNSNQSETAISLFSRMKIKGEVPTSYAHASLLRLFATTNPEMAILLLRHIQNSSVPKSSSLYAAIIYAGRKRNEYDFVKSEYGELRACGLFPTVFCLQDVIFCASDYSDLCALWMESALFEKTKKSNFILNAVLRKCQQFSESSNQSNAFFQSILTQAGDRGIDVFEPSSANTLIVVACHFNSFEQAKFTVSKLIENGGVPNSESIQALCACMLRGRTSDLPLALRWITAMSCDGELPPPVALLVLQLSLLQQERKEELFVSTVLDVYNVWHDCDPQWALLRLLQVLTIALPDHESRIPYLLALQNHVVTSQDSQLLEQEMLG